MTGVTNIPRFMIIPRALLMSLVTEFKSARKKPSPTVRNIRGNSIIKQRRIETSGINPTQMKMIIRRGTLMRKSKIVCPMTEKTRTSLGKFILVSMLPAATRLFDDDIMP